MQPDRQINQYQYFSLLFVFAWFWGFFWGGGQCILEKCRGWVFVILAEIMAQLDIWTDAFSDIRKAWFQISELEEGWGAGFFFLRGNKIYILAIFI